MSSVPPPEVVEWIAATATPFALDDATWEESGRHAIDDMVADASIVGLGASSRSAHEILVHQARIVRQLIEERGLRTIALEDAWTATTAVDATVHGTEGDLATQLARDAWAPWQCEEVLDLLRWIAAANRRLDAPTKLRVIGPGHRPEADADHHIAGDTLTRWLDAIVHIPEVTDSHSLSEGS